MKTHKCPDCGRKEITVDACYEGSGMICKLKPTHMFVTSTGYAYDGYIGIELIEPKTLVKWNDLIKALEEIK